MTSAATLEHNGFIDTYAAVPVERFDEVPQAEDDLRDDIIHAHNLHKTYLLGVEGVPALRGVNLHIKQGEFIMILGTSGGGKTSLLNIIGTIDKPTKGEITICGQRITSSTQDKEFAELRLRKIGFVFQTFNLIPSMSAEENVSLPMILAGDKSRASIARRSRELLSRVGLGHRVDHLPSQLSGGEQQRVTIARAIANRPQLLLLDEPTGDLDTVNGTIILGLLLQLNRHEAITCVMVTHDQSLKHYAHRVVHMVDGKVLRIEAISDADRNKADAELQRKVEEIQGAREAKEEEAGGAVRRGEGITELRDTATYYSYVRQQEQDAAHKSRRAEQRSSAGTYAVLPGVSATVGEEAPGQPRPPVHIHTSM